MSDQAGPIAAALRLAAIVESSDDAIISKDLNGIITTWNRGAERIFGYTAEEIVGQPITTLIPVDRLEEEAEVLRRIRAGESVDHFETLRRTKDGALIPVSLTISPIRVADGTIIGASKIARDISERRRAEMELAAAEARRDDLQRRLIALVSGSAVLFESPALEDVVRAIITVARSLIRADGYAIWRLSPRNVWEVAASAGVSEGFALASVAQEPGTVAPFLEPRPIPDVFTDPALADRYELYRREGIVSILAVPLLNARVSTGTVVFYYRATQDFNEVVLQAARAIGNLGAAAIRTAELYDDQRRSRDEATKAYRQANAANRAKDEFLATLSHELRTPLNAVLGWIRMLRAGTVPPARIPRALEVIERNADVQLRLVEDMLDLSRIITGNLRLEVQPTRLSDAIHAAVETIIPAANAKAIALGVEDEPRDIVNGDPARLQQVVWNLLSNAVKFTPRGGRIDVSVRCFDTNVELEVADTGEGIEQDTLPYVFDRFRQADSGTTRTHMGLGLGLAIVRHIVEMHGGRVSASSEGRGKGATFRLSLPASHTQQSAGRPASSGRALPAALTGPADQVPHSRE